MKTPRLLASLLAGLSFSTPSLAEEAEGHWGGILAGKLRLAAQISKTADGSYSALLGSPDQSSDKLAADKVSASATALSFTVHRLKASYVGEWNEGQQAWVGQFTQGQSTIPLVLKRTDAKGMPPIVFKRPQEQAILSAPRPYTEQEVVFTNASAGIDLAGTFSVPNGSGPFPAVVLVHGSGKNSRDVPIFDHKTFMVLADHLTRQGIAVLRYDKRGVGASKGDYAAAGIPEFAADAEAAIAWLRTRADVAKQHIGIIGHSEGGLVAPIVANRDPALAFVVLMAGPAVRGDILLPIQHELLLRAEGTNEEEIARLVALRRNIFAAMTGPGSEQEQNTKVKALLDDGLAAKLFSTDAYKQQLHAYTRQRTRAFLAHDPAPALKLVRQPLLAINGTLDMQVPAKMNLDAIRLAQGANTKATIVELPGLNHLFQTAKTGGSDEYRTIEETFAPAALVTVSDWIKRTSAQGPL